MVCEGMGVSEGVVESRIVRVVEHFLPESLKLTNGTKDPAHEGGQMGLDQTLISVLQIT